MRISAYRCIFMTLGDYVVMVMSGDDVWLVFFIHSGYNISHGRPGLDGPGWQTADLVDC